MSPPLFLLEQLPEGDTVSLTGDEGRHAARVRRLGPGEPVLVADGSGVIFDCSVREVRSDGLVLDVLARRVVPEPDPRFVVVQALPKGERADLAVEALTEFGVDEIVPWSAERAVVHWSADRAAKGVAKWRRTAREASKQSRRARVPVVADLTVTAQVVQRLAGGCGLVLHESAQDHLADLHLPPTGEIVLVVGPEGGVSDAELQRFADAGARPVRLGEPVLRTSTAGAAALAVLSTRTGRWSAASGR